MMEVNKSGEIEDGTMKEILVDGYEVLLARVNDWEGSYLRVNSKVLWSPAPGTVLNLT
jgi:hypothetical protein